MTTYAERLTVSELRSDRNVHLKSAEDSLRLLRQGVTRNKAGESLCQVVGSAMLVIESIDEELARKAAP